MPDDDHGKGHAGVAPDGKAITDRTFNAAAEAFGATKEQVKKNVLDELEDEMSE